MTDKTKESVFNCQFINPIAPSTVRLRLFFRYSLPMFGWQKSVFFFCGHGYQLDQEQDIPSHFNGSDVHRCGECVGRCPSHDKTWESIWGTFVMMNGMQKLSFMIAPVEGRIVESGHCFLKYSSFGSFSHFF